MKNKFLAPVLCCLVTLLGTLPVSAQAYRSRLHFLEEFAIHQYETGEKTRAAKEFLRLLRLDPDNAIARTYLDKITKDPLNTVQDKAQIDQLVTDISQAQHALDSYQKDQKDLEKMIRDLITENDALYASLSKRSREVLEMREKFYGIPYGYTYRDVMNNLPVDRVPQHLHSAEDILPDPQPTDGFETARPLKRAASTTIPENYQEQSDQQNPAPEYAARPNTTPTTSAATTVQDLAPDQEKNRAEINRLLADIAALQQQKNVVHIQAPAPSHVPQEPAGTLQAKRDLLLQKTQTLAEKQQSLAALRQELLSMNSGLKGANNRYIDALRLIDDYYRDIKNEISDKHYVEQKIFAELMNDYAAKIKEAQLIRYAVCRRDHALTAFKARLAENNRRLLSLDTAMAVRDRQLAGYKSLLVQHKKELEHQAALILLQQGRLSLTDKKLTGVTAQVTTIEETLKQSDVQLDRLKDNITRTRDLIARQKAGLDTMNTANQKAALDSSRADKLASMNKELVSRLETNQKALEIAGARIEHMEDRIAAEKAKAQLSLVKNPQKILQERIGDLEGKLERKIAELETAKTRLYALTALREIPQEQGNKNTPENPAADEALARARAETADLTQKTTNALTEIKRLNDVVKTKDAEIRSLQARLNELTQKP